MTQVSQTLSVRGDRIKSGVPVVSVMVHGIRKPACVADKAGNGMALSSWSASDATGAVTVGVVAEGHTSELNGTGGVFLYNP